MTPNQPSKTARATRDIEDIAEYLRTRAGLGTALRFVDRAEAACLDLAAMPRMGALLGFDEPPFSGVRRWHIEGFERHLILYRETRTGVEIVRVLHAARDIVALLGKGSP